MPRPSVKRCPLTALLIATNIAVFAYLAYTSGHLYRIGLDILYHAGALYAPDIVEHHAWWRLIAALFLHTDMMHLTMNAIALFFIGCAAERVFGGALLGMIYAVAGVSGGIVSLSMHPHDLSAGASGAIFGIFGALTGHMFAARRSPYARTQMQEIAAFLALNLFIGIAAPSVDLSAHIGGFVVGLLGGLQLGTYPRRFVPLMSIYAVMLAFMWIFSETYLASLR